MSDKKILHFPHDWRPDDNDAEGKALFDSLNARETDVSALHPLEIWIDREFLIAEVEAAIQAIKRKVPWETSTETQRGYLKAGLQQRVEFLEHLIGEGHRRIAVLIDQAAWTPGAGRLAGYRAALRDAYAEAEGLLFCGTEDFGIVPIEAMAAGCPILALAAGGLRETVVGSGPQATGRFFAEPSLAAMHSAWRDFRAACARGEFTLQTLQNRARLFDRHMFVSNMQAVIGETAPLSRRAG